VHVAAATPELTRLDNLYPGYPSSVALARVAVARFAAAAGLAGERLEDVRSCVSEAVTNAVVHAYPRGNGGPIRVAATATDQELRVRVGDDGCGLKSARPSIGLGLGMPVMTRLSHGFAVRESVSGGVDLHLRFELGSTSA
jgi:anti-sigma regulatory factor (Ser/Thr protein kinase)